MFGDVFATHADRPCLTDGERTISYADTLALGRSLIAGLPRPRAFVVLRCSLSIEAVAAYAALFVDGHVPLLLETDLSLELLEQMIQLYRPDVVIDPVAGVATPCASDPVALHPDLGVLLTTSGSTGSPKLVRQKASGVRANAESIAAYLSLGPDERPLLHLPMSYSYGLSIINSHFIAGASICLTRRSVMEPDYWNDLRRVQATSVSGVPFHYTAIRRLGETRLEIPSLTTLTQAGGRLDPKLTAYFAEWANRTGRRFVVMYGQTEAGPRIAYLPPEKALEAADAIGVPIPGVQIDLVDEDGRPVADGQPGEMVVRSPAVMMGYALAPADLALGDTLGGALHTGDLAARGEDGLLRVVGRRSRILKIYGLRINLEEIEQRLASLGHAALCFGEDDKLRVLVEGDGDAGDIRKRIVDLFSLPPRGIEVRLGPPAARSASGKISAAALQQAWDAASAPTL